MISRKPALAVAAAALVTAGVVAVPTVSAQPAGSSDLTSGSSNTGSGTTATATATATAGANSGSLNSGSANQGSLSGLAPTTTSGDVCNLPGLGGSISSLYSQMGLYQLPSIVVTLATSALNSFPNLLTVVGMDSQLATLGSLQSPICSSLLGGYMAPSTGATTTQPAATVTVTVVVSNGTTVSTIVPTPTSTSASPTSSSVPTSSVNGSLGAVSFPGS